MRKQITKNNKNSQLNSRTAKSEPSRVPVENTDLKREQHFKLRAECLDDVLLLIHRMPKSVWEMRIVQVSQLPDVEFEFKTNLTLDEILAILSKQVDSHVMMDTLRPIDEYTGERCFIPNNHNVRRKK